MGAQVSVRGMRVEEGDPVHSDRRGAIVVPEYVNPELEKAIAANIAKENLILGLAR